MRTDESRVYDKVLMTPQKFIPLTPIPIVPIKTTVQLPDFIHISNNYRGGKKISAYVAFSFGQIGKN